MCCNGKIEMPNPGKSPVHIIIFILTLVLMILTWIEIVALGSYVEVFETASQDYCCGFITEQKAGYTVIDGAVCFEKDFNTSNGAPFDIININGTKICSVNGVICDKYSDATTDQEMTINQCMNANNNYKLSDICSEDVLATEDTAGISQAACIVAIINGIILFFVGCCDLFGCFKDSAYCQNKFVAVFNKILEVFMWGCFLFISIVFIEDVAANGYFSSSLLDNDAYEYVEDECVTDPNSGDISFIWTVLELNVPEWLQSDWYGYISHIGISLSVVEFMLFFYLTCCECSKEEDEMADNTENQTATSIEMQS